MDHAVLGVSLWGSSEARNQRARRTNDASVANRVDIEFVDLVFKARFAFHRLSSSRTSENEIYLGAPRLGMFFFAHKITRKECGARDFNLQSLI